MNRMGFFNKINSEIEANKIDIAAEARVREASSACTAYLCDRFVKLSDMIGKTILYTKQLRQSTIVIVFAGREYTCFDADYAEYDGGSFLEAEALGIYDAAEVNILPDHLFHEFKEACKARDAKQEVVRGLQALQQAKDLLGKEKAQNLLENI